MPDRQVSRTAFGTAYMRAAHQLLDASPRILDDPIIVTLLGQQAVERIIRSPGQYQTPERRGLRAHVVLRSRFAEDRLAIAVQRGVTQFVILGAGLDTFALRQPVWAQQLRIIEVDHSGTQATKQGLLKIAGLAVPENVTFAAIDFEHETLREGLVRHSVSFDQPIFFSWLGVTMYLNETAIDSVLHTIAQFPTGTEVVLTFARADGPPSPFDRRSAELGEQWLSYFTPDTMEAKLRNSGFSDVDFLTASEAEAMYFQTTGGSLPAPQRTNIVSARV
jgi:methyltransferase (TIGR00027 family)